MAARGPADKLVRAPTTPGRRAAMLLPTLALLLTGAIQTDKPDQDPKTDQEQLQGTWTVQSATRDGTPAPEDMVKNTRFVFNNDKVTIRDGQRGRDEEAIYALDGSKKPATID